MKLDFANNSSKAIISVMVSVVMFPYMSSSAQVEDCNYDKNSPSLQSARTSLRTFQSACSISEIDDFFRLKTTASAKDSAEAFVLLAEANYYLIEEKAVRDSVTLYYFSFTFKVDPKWEGVLVVRNPQLKKILDNARARSKSELLSPVEKKWWKKWYVLGGAGIGVGSIIYFIIVKPPPPGPEGQTIPEFPPPPN